MLSWKSTGKMLTEFTATSDSSNADTLPVSLITTDDGRTILAVTEHDNGILEIMATPITLMQQSDTVSPPLIKTLDGNLILHPHVFQVSVEGLTANGIHEAALLPVQTLGTTTPTVFEGNGKETDTEMIDHSSLTTEYTIFHKTPRESQNETETTWTAIDKNTSRKSPGRPRKNDSSRTDMKCDICGQEFVKQMLFKKHMEHHAEEKPHRCPKCPASFNIPTNFTLHMATHNTGEPKCPECGRRFARMASLKSHMLLHEKEENLFCTECEDAFSTRAQLDAHLKLHGEKWTTEDVRKCKLCNKQFVQPALYRLHIREHYRLQTKVVKQTKRGAKYKTIYKCTICLKTFQKPSQLMRHIRVHTGEKPFKCATCGRAFTQKGSLQIHMWQHNGIRPHSCSLCNAKFSQKGNLNAHILRVHNAPEGEPIYGCTQCSCVFKKLGSLNGHMKRMHSKPVEDTPSKCDSSTEADMRATVNTVISQLASLESTGNEPVNSTNSDSASAAAKNDILQQALNNSGLQSKNKTSNENTDSDAKKESEARTSYVTLLDRTPDGNMRKYLTIKQRCIGNIRWYACSFCHKEFKKPSDLIRHLRVHTQEKPFKCSHCFRSFALKSTMIAHERTHAGAKKYSCGSCSKTFACHASLAAHAKQHAKPHKCNMCDKTFSSSGILKSHIKSHSRCKTKISPEAESLVPQIVLQEPLVISDAGNKISVAHVQSKQNPLYNNEDVARPHKCWVCHAAFRKISHLKQHYRRHTGERPYKCTKCDRRFTSNSVLKSHLHTHEDSRPYSCPVCNTKFSTQSSMKRHLVTHSNKRPFMCPYCHKTFKTSVNCRKHMKIHKQELAQRQLEQQKSTKENLEEPLNGSKRSMTMLSENLTLTEDMEVPFQPQIAPDFSQAFSDQFQSMTNEKEKSFLSTDNTTQSITNQNLPEVHTSNMGSSQTLHADESGTITLPNYSGEQTLTPESIREIEETLNQQLFNIGMNLGLGHNIPRRIDDTSTSPLGSREPPVLNIIYENSKNIESSGNSMFTSHFDTFDMSQITLQSDSEIDIGLNTTNSTSMSSILPRTSQEERLAPVITTNDITDNQVKVENRHLLIVNPEENCSHLSNLVQTCQKFSKVIAKTHTTNTPEIQTTIRPLEQNNNENNNSGKNNEGTSTTLLCDICNKVFQTAAELKAHSKIHGISNIMCPDNSLLQCHICNQRSLTTAELKEHLKIHRTIKEYRCPECSLRFCTNGGLSRHMKMHTSKQQWICAFCQKVFSSKTQLKSHAKVHEINWNTTIESSGVQQNAISVTEKLSSISDLDVRIGTDSSVSEKVLLDTVVEKHIMERENNCAEKKEKKEYTNKCKYCPKTFRKPSDLIRHIRTHTGERPYKCEHCNKSFAVKCTLDSHMKVHTGKKTFCCHVCSSMFATKGSLKVHMRLHTGSKPFRCPVCDLRFRTSGHRKVHLLKHAREHKSSPKRKQKHLKVAAIAEAASNVEKSVETTSQSVSIETDVTLAQPVEYPQLDSINIDTSGITNQITFNTDGTVLNNNSMLSINESNQLVANLHFLLANGLATIQTDDILITQPQGTDVNVTQNEARIAELITASTLEIPRNDTSTMANQLVIASQIPTNVSTPTDHATLQLRNCINLIQMNENNGKPIKADKSSNKSNSKGSQSKKECDICGKTFMKPYQVERHKRIHTGERPYKCELCTKSFAQKSTLQMHQKHHTGDRPHSCPHCEYSFTQKGNLQTHLKRVHQLDTLEFKKLRRSQPELSAKLTQENLGEAKILNLDDISFVEFLK